MTLSIEVENKFGISQRDIHILRKVSEEIKERHRVNYPGDEKKRAVRLSLEDVDDQGDYQDYLEISLDNQQLDLGPCRVELTSNLSLTFFPTGIESLKVIPSENGKPTTLRIPPGLPGWKLAIRSSGSRVAERNTGDETNSGPGGGDGVTIGDDGPGGW